MKLVFAHHLFRVLQPYGFHVSWKKGVGLVLLIVFLVILSAVSWSRLRTNGDKQVLSLKPQPLYWFLLHRKSNVEFLYFGVPGVQKESKLIKTMQVKAGIPRERPTPLPKLVGREYWRIVDKMETHDNPETAPYFLTLDVPVGEEEPFGPVPYEECNGPSTSLRTSQCNWILPGAFGLHGINGDWERLSNKNPGSSGCLRHKDEDITYLYNLLDPKRQEIRYYIEDI